MISQSDISKEKKKKNITPTMCIMLSHWSYAVITAKVAGNGRIIAKCILSHTKRMCILSCGLLTFASRFPILLESLGC